MNFFLKFLGFISLFFVLTFESFAIDAPVNVEIESFTDTSVNITWEPTENAIMYYVYYSKESGNVSDYDNYSDFIEGNSVEIKDLEKGQNYYFAVTSLDENGEESIYSDEIIFDVNNIDINLKADNNINFALDGLNVISYNTIQLSFNSSLENSADAIREFKITNKDDNLDTFEVISSKLNDKNNSIIELTLDKEMKVGNQYEVVIIAITSSNGKNIESGIDNIEAFTVNQIEKLPDLNSVGNEELPDLNSAGNEKASLVGTNINADEIEKTTLVLAEKQTALPQTGPEHILILILSIILGAGVFLFKFKRL